MKAYHGNLFAQARESDEFRRVVHTSDRTQLVLMTIPAGGEIGTEVHPDTDQVLIAVQGHGRSVLDGVERPFEAGDTVVVPSGTRHNFVNPASEPLRLVTVYSPPHHRPGTVHHTRRDEEADPGDVPPGG